MQRQLRRKFHAPLALRDGRAIETLAGARLLLLSLPEARRRHPHWQYAATMLAAAERGESLVAAAGQLRLALIAEGLM